MTTGRSFAEYVKSKCYNGLYSAAESFVGDTSDELNLWSRKINNTYPSYWYPSETGIFLCLSLPAGAHAESRKVFFI